MVSRGEKNSDPGIVDRLGLGLAGKRHTGDARTAEQCWHAHLSQKLDDQMIKPKAGDSQLFLFQLLCSFCCWGYARRGNDIRIRRDRGATVLTCEEDGKAVMCVCLQRVAVCAVLRPVSSGKINCKRGTACEYGY